MNEKELIEKIKAHQITSQLYMKDNKAFNLNELIELITRESFKAGQESLLNPKDLDQAMMVYATGKLASNCEKGLKLIEQAVLSERKRIFTEIEKFKPDKMNMIYIHINQWNELKSKVSEATTK